MTAFLALTAIRLFACSQANIHRLAKDPNATLDARIAAVEKLTDQALLADLAKNDLSDHVYLAAALKLNEHHQPVAQAAFAEIAKNAKNQDLREIAITRLTDQTWLLNVVKNTKHEHIRIAATEKLDEHHRAMAQTVRNEQIYTLAQANLVTSATSATSWHQRMAAAQQLDKQHHAIAQATFADIARNAAYSQHTFFDAKEKRTKTETNAPDWDLRHQAAEKLDEQHQPLAQATFAGVAKNAMYWVVRESAMKKLTDQTLILDIAKTDEHLQVRLAAMERLDPQSAATQAMFTDAAKNDKHPWIRLAAIEKLHPPHHTAAQAVFADVAKNETKFPNAQRKAIKKLTDPTILTAIAKNDKNKGTREAAEKRLAELTEETTQPK